MLVFKMHSVGIDTGYGDIKVVGYGQKLVKFPSRWIPHENKSWAVNGISTGLSVDGIGFSYGNNAIGKNIHHLTKDKNLTDEETVPLLAAALWESGIENDGKTKEIVLGTGTPISSFEKDFESITETLEGREFVISAESGEERSYLIKKVVMVPQGFAAMLYLLNRRVINRREGLATIIDIGSKTTDLFTMNLYNFDPIAELCFTINRGIGDAVANLNRIIAKRTGFILPIDLASEALQKRVTFRNMRVGGEFFSEPVLRELGAELKDRILENFGADIDRITALIPMGGGANLIGREFRSLAPDSYISVLEDTRVFGNAFGYKQVADDALES